MQSIGDKFLPVYVFQATFVNVKKASLEILFISSNVMLNKVEAKMKLNIHEYNASFNDIKFLLIKIKHFKLVVTINLNVTNFMISLFIFMINITLIL